VREPLSRRWHKSKAYQAWVRFDRGDALLARPLRWIEISPLLLLPGKRLSGFPSPAIHNL
jgi:hypothetical protein